MTTTDYLLLGAFAAASLYTGCRLFLGWLRTSQQVVSEATDRTDSSA